MASKAIGNHGSSFMPDGFSVRGPTGRIKGGKQPPPISVTCPMPVQNFIRAQAEASGVSTVSLMLQFARYGLLSDPSVNNESVEALPWPEPTVWRERKAKSGEIVEA